MPSIPVRAALCAGAVTSLVAGAAAGLVDGLWSWSPASQFVPDLGGKLRLLLYLAAAYGLTALVIGTVLIAVGVFYLRCTRLGDLLRHAGAEHRRVRAAEPRDALAGLSLVLVGLPALAGLLALAWWRTVPALAGRKHDGLVIAVAMAATLAAIAGALLIALALGRLVELGLRRLARRPALGRALSSPRAPVIAAAALAALGGAVAAAASWETLRQLHLRGAFVALLAVGLAAGFARAGWRIGEPLGRIHAGVTALSGAVAVAALGLIVIAAGDRGGVIKAATAYSGLGGPIAKVIRVAGDLDRDGYSRFLGGGDCDDGDPDTNPGADEIPGDGRDQNCVSGDLPLELPPPRTPADVGFAAVPASLPADFNVLLITIDTLRADHLGAYGYGRDTSPVIDALAAEGTLFVNGWAHAPSTRYSMPAILTGRMPLDVPYDTSVPGWPGILPRATTIAEVLGARGLSTAAITNHWYFDERRRMNQGFDHYDNQNSRLHRDGKKGPAESAGSSSAQQTDKALEVLSRYDQVEDRAFERFFLWVHYYDPHYTYETHDGVPSFGDADVDRYDHEIRFTDQQLGRLFDDLRARGLWDKTVVVITGDHGEGFGEHGIDFHGYELYGPQTKVPFIVRVPGQPARRVTTPVGHVDLLPTLANLAGAAPTPEMMGRSLVDLIAGTGDGDADRVVFQQLSYENQHELRGAVSQRCHVLYNVSPVTSWEVYRLDLDPAERRDVVDDPGPCAETRDQLARWYETSKISPDAGASLLSGPPDVASPLDVDFGSEVRLRAVELPATVKAGDTFDVTWTFEARGRLAVGWSVFAHFDGPRSAHFKGDHVPARPFEWWQPGDHVRYTRSVTVPATSPAGRYTLWAGLFKRGQRRPARADGVEVVADRAAIATIEVTRP